MPVAEFLVKSGFEVVGIDISSGMVETAHKNVPGATFRQMDMTELDFPPESFDGLISTYAIFHVPREMHAGIFRSFHTILKPQGVMLVSVASCAWEEFADYMGVEMSRQAVRNITGCWRVNADYKRLYSIGCGQVLCKIVTYLIIAL
jgi:2-polyprenyl-3-methyl-5-hydroxy-6-metoxy-1,4-benzoquinol methylase